MVIDRTSWASCLICLNTEENHVLRCTKWNRVVSTQREVPASRSLSSIKDTLCLHIYPLDLIVFSFDISEKKDLKPFCENGFSFNTPKIASYLCRHILYIMNTISLHRLISLSRPRFWLYELGTYALGVAAGWSATSPAMLWYVLLFGFFFLFPANLFIYGINDIYDYETDILNPKKQSYEDTLPKDIHRSVYYTALLSVFPFVVLSFFVHIYATIALFLFLFFAYFYSAPPIRAKSRPGWDSFFSGAHYTVTGAFGYYLVSSAPAHGLVFLGLLAGLLYTLAMHAYSAIPDITADTQAGIRTVATFFGSKKTIALAYLCYGISGLIFGYLVSWIGIVLVLPYYVLLYASLGKQDESLLPIYTYFPYVNAVTGMIVFWSIILR